MSPESISFGFLMLPLQLRDMCRPMDVLGGADVNELAGMGTPEALVSQGANFTFHYIGTEHELTPVTTSISAPFQPTCTIYDCPELDYLLVGGPQLPYIESLPADVASFIVNRSSEVETLFSTCTGGLVLAKTGLLDGLPATTNHLALQLSPGLFPQVNWTTDKNWLVSDDGHYWTGAGAVAGMDMVSHWVRQKLGDDIWRISCQILGYQPRDVDGNFIPLDG